MRAYILRRIAIGLMLIVLYVAANQGTISGVVSEESA